MDAQIQVRNFYKRVLSLILAVLLLLSSAFLTGCSEEPSSRIVVYPVPIERSSSSHTTCVGGINVCS
jgi:uncharacterized lipoprotein YajG